MRNTFNLVAGLMLLASFFCVGCSTRWQYLPTDEELNQPLPKIYVVGHGWHTGLVVPASAIPKDLAEIHQTLPFSAFYEIGWGDKGFYQADEITSGITVRAIFWPTESVMHVVSLPKEPQTFFPQSDVVELKLSQQALDKLMVAISRSFARDSQGEILRTQKGLYGQSWFYQGEGSYYMTNTCNTWVAKMLDEAGVPFRTFMTLTSSSVIEQAKEAAANYPCAEVN
ncbi:TIGR02117 family protein [Corallincola platygyrae]|uniref:TIGR02117 family protein n=1 Tax=Corallincola platygyrae TaxID=1193278 RepID=A0ABW4XLQ9_9GAMM